MVLHSHLPRWVGLISQVICHLGDLSTHTFSPPSHLERIHFQFLISFSLPPLSSRSPAPRCPLLGQLKCSCRFQLPIIWPKGLNKGRGRGGEEWRKERKVWDDILALLGSCGCKPGLVEQVFIFFSDLLFSTFIWHKEVLHIYYTSCEASSCLQGWLFRFFSFLILTISITVSSGAHPQSLSVLHALYSYQMLSAES